MKAKRILAAVLIPIILLSVFAACSGPYALYGKIESISAFNPATGENIELPFTYKKGTVTEEYSAFISDEDISDIAKKINAVEDENEYTVVSYDKLLMITKRARNGRMSVYYLSAGKADEKGKREYILFDSHAVFSFSASEGTTAPGEPASSYPDFSFSFPYHLIDDDSITDIRQLFTPGTKYRAKDSMDAFISFYNSLGVYSVLKGESSFSLESTNSPAAVFADSLPVCLSFSYESGGVYFTVDKASADIYEDSGVTQAAPESETE